MLNTRSGNAIDLPIGVLGPEIAQHKSCLLENTEMAVRNNSIRNDQIASIQ